MSKPNKIPEIRFENRQRKPFEFEILHSSELLGEVEQGGHNPYRPYRISFYALLFVLEGEGNHFVDFDQYSFKQGSVIFISRDQVHAFEKGGMHDAYFMIFTENFLERGSAGSSLMQQLSLYNYQLYDPVLQLKEEELSVFKSLLYQIKEEYDAPDDFATSEIIHSSLKIFLCMAERIRKKKSDLQLHPHYHEEFLNFQNLLKTHIFQTRQVKFYADQMAISSKKLNRITYEMIQKPVKAYINENLILEMKRLLMNTALSVKEISYKTGFEAPTNFIKFFKRYTGQTPAEFRRQYL